MLLTLVFKLNNMQLCFFWQCFLHAFGMHAFVSTCGRRAATNEEEYTNNICKNEKGNLFNSSTKIQSQFSGVNSALILVQLGCRALFLCAFFLRIRRPYSICHCDCVAHCCCCCCWGFCCISCCDFHFHLQFLLYFPFGSCLVCLLACWNLFCPFAHVLFITWQYLAYNECPELSLCKFPVHNYVFTPNKLHTQHPK